MILQWGRWVGSFGNGSNPNELLYPLCCIYLNKNKSIFAFSIISQYCPDSKVHGGQHGATWVLSAPDGPWPHEPCYQSEPSQVVDVPSQNTKKHTMTSSNRRIFGVTVPLCGESTGLQWISRTKGQQRRPLTFLCCQSEQTFKQTID